MARLNFINLETVCCIARFGSFTDAAEFMHTTQPAISARVRELESALGTPLFRKSGRRMELTLAGRELVRQVEPLLRQIAGTVDSLTDPRSLSAHVHIGMSTISMTWFPKLMAELKRTMPRVRYKIEIAHADHLVADLKTGRLDVAIVGGSVDRKNLHSVSLGTEQFQWMISPTLKKTSGSAGSRHWLERYPIWCVDNPSFSFEAVTRALKTLGVSAAQLNTVSSFAGVIDLLKGGAGISLLPVAVRQDPVTRKLLIPLSSALPEDRLEFSICMASDAPHPILSRIVESAVAVARAELAPRRSRSNSGVLARK